MRIQTIMCKNELYSPQTQKITQIVLHSVQNKHEQQITRIQHIGSPEQSASTHHASQVAIQPVQGVSK